MELVRLGLASKTCMDTVRRSWLSASYSTMANLASKNESTSESRELLPRRTCSRGRKWEEISAGCLGLDSGSHTHLVHGLHGAVEPP